MCAVAPAPVGLSHILHDSVNVLMYPAAEIVALVYVGGLQKIGGLVMLPRLVCEAVRSESRSPDMFPFSAHVGNHICGQASDKQTPKALRLAEERLKEMGA